MNGCFMKTQKNFSTEVSAVDIDRLGNIVYSIEELFTNIELIIDQNTGLIFSPGPFNYESNPQNIPSILLQRMVQDTLCQYQPY